MATVRTARTRAVCSGFWPVSPSWSPPACPEVQVLAYRSFPLLICGNAPCMDILCPWVIHKQSERISMENPQRNPASNGTEYGAGNLFLGDVREEL